MADEQLIKPRELPAATNVFSNDAIMTDDGVTVGKATPVQIVNAGAPVPTEAEAIAGSDNSKRMTPLTVKQVLDSVTAPSVMRASAWAESSTPPDPGMPGSKSAKSWAEIAGDVAHALSGYTEPGYLAEVAEQASLAEGARSDAELFAEQASISALSSKSSSDSSEIFANRAEAAADASIQAGQWDQEVADEAARLALTGLATNWQVYQLDTEHVWRWDGSAWVDRGESPLALKANLSAFQELDRSLSASVQKIGVLDEPLPSGSNASFGTYVFGEAFIKSGRGLRYTFVCNLAGSITVGVATTAGDVHTVVAERTFTAVLGENVLELDDFPVEVGQVPCVRFAQNGRVAAVAGSAGNAGGWYYTNVQVSAGNSFTDDSLTTNTRIINRFEVLDQVATGPAVKDLQDRVADLEADRAPDAFHLHWAIGESHVAGATTTLSPVQVPVGRGFSYRRATESLGQLKDPTGNSATAVLGRGSFYPGFGNEVLRVSGGVIGAVIVNSGLGGTTVDTHWSASGTAWLQAVDDFDAAIDAILADKIIISGVSVSIAIGSNNAAAGTSKSAFKSALLDLIVRIRTKVGGGPDVPIILVQTGPYADGSYTSAVADIQAAQAEIAQEEGGVFMGYSARYAVDRGQMIDNVHMNQTFNDACGRALAVPALMHGAGLYPAGLD